VPNIDRTVVAGRYATTGQGAGQDVESSL